MIRVRGLVKEFPGGVRAINGVDFEVPKGSLVTLLGPSGCGKTTTLRSIAGLDEPTAGTIEIGDRVVFDSAKNVLVPANKRRIGMVFQSYAIWPHMTVFDNVAYPLRHGKVKKAELRERVMAALELVGLAELAPRQAPKLSGGQQQRVALARALVAEPEVLLLDEPLSNLDAKLREAMRQEIREIQQRLGITTLYVTHDQVEALAISDVVAVMSKGNIVDFGSPQRIYEAPSSRFVAEFIGLANVVPVTNVEDAGAGLRGTAAMGPMGFSDNARAEPVAGAPASAGQASVLVRLEDVHISRERPPHQENVWRGTVASALFLGTHFDCVVQVGGQRLRAQVPRSVGLAAGDEVWVQVPAECALRLREDPPEIVGDPTDEDVEEGRSETELQISLSP
jgi:iron(III) transport system ATP-binding protein